MSKHRHEPPAYLPRLLLAHRRASAAACSARLPRAQHAPAPPVYRALLRPSISFVCSAFYPAYKTALKTYRSSIVLYPPPPRCCKTFLSCCPAPTHHHLPHLPLRAARAHRAFPSSGSMSYLS